MAVISQPSGGPGMKPLRSSVWWGMQTLHSGTETGAQRTGALAGGKPGGGPG